MELGDVENHEMKGLLIETQLAQETAGIVERYCSFCRNQQLLPHPSVLVFLRLCLPELRPKPYVRAGNVLEHTFTDADLFALCDFLLRGHAATVFEHWTRVNLKACSISSIGALMLSRVFRLPGCRVHTVNLENQRIGTDGAAALAEAVRLCRHLSTISMRSSFILDKGAQNFIELMQDGDQAVGHLETLDLSNNFLSFDACTRLQLVTPPHLDLVLKGNRVLDEVLNAVSHAIGTILVILGAIFLAIKVGQTPLPAEYNGVAIYRSTYVASTTIYSSSLFVLYLSSTLFHSVFAMGDAVVNVFGILDYCSIYLLIAGTYTPFLLLLFPDNPIWSTWLVIFMWCMAFAGLALAIFYHGKLKTGLQVASYIAMGWSALLCMHDLWARLCNTPFALVLLVGGGVAYTAGVPFFARDKRTLGIPDHTIWHCFVLAGSMLHYFCIYNYVVQFPVLPDE